MSRNAERGEKVFVSMKLNRIIFGLIVLTLIFQQPPGRQAEVQIFRPALSQIWLGSNCQKLLYLPEPSRRSIFHRFLD